MRDSALAAAKTLGLKIKIVTYGAQERDAPIQQDQLVRVLGWTNRPHSFPGGSVQTVQLNCWLQEGASANPATANVTLVGKEEQPIPVRKENRPWEPSRSTLSHLSPVPPTR